MLKIYKFSGSGNYSSDFDWEEEISYTLGEEITFKEALEIEASLKNYSVPSFGLPEQMKEGVYSYELRHGGNINVEGILICPEIEQSRGLELVLGKDGSYGFILNKDEDFL